jgi:outer membrane protein assembly factor BamB
VRVKDDPYLSLLLAAVLSGVFSAIVCSLLILDFTKRWDEFPLDLPEYQRLRTELSQQPDQGALRDQIRQRDLELRQEYARQRRFTYRGGFLLAGGVAATLLFARLAARLRRRLPMPSSTWPSADPDTPTSRFGTLAVGGLAAVIALLSIVLAVTVRSPIPRSPNELARTTPPGAVAPEGGPASTTAPPPLPSAEEALCNWPRFRGPQGSGVYVGGDPPLRWDDTTGEGILWKGEVPLPGNNSPIVWGDRVFLTGATRDAHEIYCFHAKTGTIIWTTRLQGQPRATDLKVSEDTGFAAPTAATDGRYVYAIFASGHVYAVDFEGQQVWTSHLGVPQSVYGYAASLTVHDGRLIVQFDQGMANDQKSKLLALATATGDTVWETPRLIPNSWSSPIVVEQAGEAEIITCGDPWVIAYAATDGSERWRAKCLRQDVGPSPVWNSGVLYVVSEFPHLSAIRGGGQGDVTDTNILWTAEFGLPDTCSPLATDQFLLLLASYGTLTCYDRLGCGEGLPLWRERPVLGVGDQPRLGPPPRRRRFGRIVRHKPRLPRWPDLCTWQHASILSGGVGHSLRVACRDNRSPGADCCPPSKSGSPRDFTCRRRGRRQLRFVASRVSDQEVPHDRLCLRST